MGYVPISVISVKNTTTFFISYLQCSFSSSSIEDIKVIICIYDLSFKNSPPVSLYFSKSLLEMFSLPITCDGKKGN